MIAACRGTASLCWLQVQVKLSEPTISWVATKPYRSKSPAGAASGSQGRSTAQLVCLLSRPAWYGARKIRREVESRRKLHYYSVHVHLLHNTHTHIHTFLFNVPACCEGKLESDHLRQSQLLIVCQILPNRPIAIDFGQTAVSSLIMQVFHGTQ